MRPFGAQIIDFDAGETGFNRIALETDRGEDVALEVENGEIVVRDPHDGGGDS